jgi:ubiquinone/menaquinone biosynthesis C-methylase UbiE
MVNLEIDNSAIGRRIVRSVCDLARRPLTGLRVLDLACAHGAYAIEMAKLGAQVLGIEGQESWLKVANEAKKSASLSNVDFVQDDVRNLCREKYGEFDIVLCLGILYHLDAPDVFDFLQKICAVCREFTIVETHFAETPSLYQEWKGKRYWGTSAHEHHAGTAPAEKLKDLGASLDNEKSFWITQASLYNILRHVGFTSVYDCRIPMAYMYVGEKKEFKMWGNRVTLAAMKGQPFPSPVLFGSPVPTESEVDWPESTEEFLFERFLAGQ